MVEPRVDWERTRRTRDCECVFVRTKNKEHERPEFHPQKVGDGMNEERGTGNHVYDPHPSNHPIQGVIQHDQHSIQRTQMESSIVTCTCTYISGEIKDLELGNKYRKNVRDFQRNTSMITKPKMEKL